MGKNIVICCDGTNNAIVGDQTNVLRLFRMLSRDSNQEIFYDAGVGTKADPTALWPWRRFVRKEFDAAVGNSIRDNVLDAYRFLIQRYDPDDKVFLFGFSRGAYTVRALGALIARCGLLRPEYAHLCEYAWSVFSDEDHSNDRRRRFGGVARIKKVFGAAAEIHFVGVWDTVSSFGWFWDQLTLPDTATNPVLAHVRHAISIDETRAFFTPNFFHPAQGQDCKEVWFAGVHGDVGGGYADSEAGLARVALRWMISEARVLGLHIDSVLQDEMLQRMGDRAVPDELGPQHDESRRRVWRIAAWLPRRAFSGAKSGRKWRWPNRPRKRAIPEGAWIHQSVQSRIQQSVPAYSPQLPSQFTFVNDRCS
jgi:uncharacterized protein (DUF2235 family)